MNFTATYENKCSWNSDVRSFTEAGAFQFLCNVCCRGRKRLNFRQNKKFRGGYFALSTQGVKGTKVLGRLDRDQAERKATTVFGAEGAEARGSCVNMVKMILRGGCFRDTSRFSVNECGRLANYKNLKLLRLGSMTDCGIR